MIDLSVEEYQLAKTSKRVRRDHLEEVERALWAQPYKAADLLAYLAKYKPQLAIRLSREAIVQLCCHYLAYQRFIYASQKLKYLLDSRKDLNPRIIEG